MEIYLFTVDLVNKYRVINVQQKEHIYYLHVADKQTLELYSLGFLMPASFFVWMSFV